MTKAIPLLFLSLLCTVIGQSQTHLSGQVAHFKKDSLKIVVLVNPIIRRSETYLVPVVNGRFDKELSISAPTKLYVTDGTNYINGLVEPGDQVNIFYDADNVSTSLQFTGKGNQKFYFLNTFFQFKLYNKLKDRLLVAKTKKYPFDNLFRYIDSVGNVFTRRLTRIKPFISAASFNLLKAEVTAAIMGNRYRSVGLVYHESMEETLQKRQAELTPLSKKYLQNVLTFDNTLSYSSSYLNEVYNILFVHYDGLVLSGKATTDLLRKYAYLTNHIPDKLRIPVLTLFLESDINKLNQAEELERVIRQTYSSYRDTAYKNYTTKRYADAISFKKGMDAPDFELENQQGEKVTLATFKGKVIYLDFWYGACGPCHALFSSIKPVKEYYSQNDSVVFLCVSIDPKDTWEKALSKYGIAGYHVFTENKESSHPVIKSYKVAGYPTTCLIDKAGKIFMANPSHQPEELKKQIDEALRLE